MKTQQSQLPWIVKSPICVTVVGDLILDEYLEGIVTRISPEAPVPVILTTGSSKSAGGAANAARNIKLSGGEVNLLGVWGKDEAAASLRRLLEADGISCEEVLATADRPTIRKTRIVANRQQLARLDWEKAEPITESERNELWQRTKNMQAHAILISDYGKGSLPPEFLQQIINAANQKKIPTIIDPKGKDYARYAGAFLVKPNRNEACEALNIDVNSDVAPAELAARLQKHYGLRNVLVTLGSKGMYWLPEPGSSAKALHLAAESREVFDVSGAGDTVSAIMALSIAAGAEFPEAMRIANAAAGRVVEKWGTQPITRAELEAALMQAAPASAGHTSRRKIVSSAELRNILGQGRTRRSRVAFTNGCFDILHYGHVSYLEAARAKADVLVVGVNSDASVRRLKGATRPVIGAEHRMGLLAALSCVDYVVAFEQDTPAELIGALVPDVLVKGADWPVDKIVGGDVVLAAGGKVENIDLVPDLSTTAIIKRLKSADFK